MIPYVPEGPPPLDEEDAGSPMDSPVGLRSVLQSLGAPASTFTTVDPAESPKPCKSERSRDDNFDDFQSAPTPACVPSLVTKQDDSESSHAKDPTRASPSDSPRKDGLVNGFPPPSLCEASQDDEEFDDFGDFRTVPAEVELRKSVVEEDSDPEQEKTGMNGGSDDNEDDAFDDFQQADSNESEAAVGQSESERSVLQSPADELTEADRHQLEDDADFGAFASGQREQVESVRKDEDEFNAFLGPQTEDFRAFEASTGDEVGQSREKIDMETESKKKDEDEFNTFQGGQSEEFAAFQASTGDEIQSGNKSGKGVESDKKDEAEFDAFQSGHKEDLAVFQGSTEEVDDDDGGFGTFREAADKEEGKNEEAGFDAFKEAAPEADDFSDFQSLREGNAGEDADFGDFADFAQADNHFNAFEESSPGQGEHDGDGGGGGGGGGGGSSSSGGFGDFSQSDSKTAEEKSEDSVGFPAFESAKDSEPSSLLERILANMEKVLSNCYASADELPEADLAPDDAAEEGSEEEAALWSLLIDFDKAFALQYQLAKSLGNECFLKALNIDSRNVLKNTRKSALPVFASQLGLLEPTRGQPEAGPAPPEPPGASTGAPEGEPTIPASEFDWTSSGLTNPLDKLEEQFLCKELAGPPGAGLEVRLDPVQSILTRVRGTSGTGATKVETELSTEARVYLDRLANLDYMKARVLMFPVGPS